MYCKCLYLYIHTYITLYKVSKFAPNRPTAQSRSRGTVLLFLNLGARTGGLSAPRPGRFTPGKDTLPLVQEAGWTPGPVWTDAKNLALTGIRSPDRPARSKSPYRLSYRARLCHVRSYFTTVQKHPHFSYKFAPRIQKQVRMWKTSSVSQQTVCLCVWVCHVISRQNRALKGEGQCSRRMKKFIDRGTSQVVLHSRYYYRKKHRWTVRLVGQEACNGEMSNTYRICSSKPRNEVPNL
jgi:hypothetical protein